MVTIKQVQDGFVRFVDNYVACAFEGWKKYAVSGAAALLANNIPNLISAYPVVTALGIYNSETKTVDIEALRDAFVTRLGGERISINIMPKETIRIGREDLETLIKCIKEA
jgi:hypothetical protein